MAGARLKHPALRLANAADVDPQFLWTFYADLQTFGTLTPFPDLITDYEIDGAYACGRAELHSDIDINICTDTEENRQIAIAAIVEYPDQWRTALRFSKTLWTKYGVRIELKLQYPAAKDVENIMSFSLRDQMTYGTNSGDNRGVVIPVRTPRLSLGYIDPETGNLVEVQTFDPRIHDPWYRELSIWQQRYGDRMLSYGNTPETDQM